MERIEVDIAIAAEAQLGEGPSWDAETATLLWVDLLADLVLRSDVSSGQTKTVMSGTTVGAVVPRAGGGLVAAVPGGFRALGEEGWGAWFAQVESDRPGNRMNDAKCAPDGSFWAGSMARDATAGAGSLYQLSPDGRVDTILSGLTIANGLGWDTRDRMYFIDTATDGIDILQRSTNGWSRRRFVDIPRSCGMADGLCVDADDNIWVALCFGGKVLCYTPTGRHIRTVEVPAILATSVCFGGPALDLLYVTTGRTGLSAADLSEQPAAGSVFVCEPGVTGLPTTAFAG